MLTVKHIDENGVEEVFQAHEVRYDPNVCGAGSTGSIWFERDPTGNGGSQRLSAHMGTVFVMNDKGKTVARYNLSDAHLQRDPQAPTPVRVAMGGGGGSTWVTP